MARIVDRLTKPEQQALLAVWRLGDTAYGAAIRDELAQRTGRLLSISAIYVTLVRLERRQYLSSTRSAPEPVRGGKSKRYFRVEQKGILALRQARTEFERLWEGLSASQELEEAG